MKFDVEWPKNWGKMQESDGYCSLPIYRQEFLQEFNDICQFEDDVIAELQKAVNIVVGDETLGRLALMWYKFGILGGQSTWDWPNPFPLFPAVVILIAFPHMFTLHKEKDIPLSVTRDNYKDLEIWMKHSKRTTGEWGFREFGWMTNHCLGKLYRLGRLQFIHQTFRGGVAVYRHISTGKLVALSAPGIHYRGDGLVDGTNGVTDDAAWTSTLEICENCVKGYLVRPDGYAAGDFIELSLQDWELALGSGDATLDVHIPEDGRLNYPDFLDSFDRALPFYAKHFPELAVPKAFTCSSWLLDSQYEKILPPESNIVRFQQFFNRYPLRSDDQESFRRVFGKVPENLTTASRDTGLRRAMIDFTLQGGRLHAAVGFHLVER